MALSLTRSLGASANEERCAEGRALPVVLIMAGPVDCSPANKNRSVVPGLNVELCEEGPLCENANNPAVPTTSGLRHQGLGLPAFACTPEFIPTQRTHLLRPRKQSIHISSQPHKELAMDRVSGWPKASRHSATTMASGQSCVEI
jgi:hypothetical protein